MQKSVAKAMSAAKQSSQHAGVEWSDGQVRRAHVAAMSRGTEGQRVSLHPCTIILHFSSSTLPLIAEIWAHCKMTDASNV